MIGSEGAKGFEKVRVIVHVILVACVKVSVESVVESLVSRYENHFTASRQLTEENVLNLYEANGILEHALNDYRSAKSRNGKWHSIRSGENIKSYLRGCSKVIRKMLSEPSKLPFMA